MSIQNIKKGTFLRNTWYVAALSTEVEGDALFNRKILDESVLIYRKGSGEPTAMSNRCAHRFAPLHMGKRNGDNVVCLYHGLEFDCSGTCVKSPHGKGHISKAAQLKDYPVVDRYGFIWIWMGDADKADASKIVDCSRLFDVPETALGYIYMHNKANYELIQDNIMDLSHIDHLHGPLINTGGNLSPLMPNVKEEEDGIRIRWDWGDVKAMLLLAVELEKPEEPAKQFFEVKWYPPSVLSLDVAAVQGSENFFEDGVMLRDFHIMTPETDETTHYFFVSTRNYRLDDAEYNKMKMEGMRDAFMTEDKPVIEAQQIEMGTTDLWSLNPVLLSCDAGAVRVRRRLSAMISEEQKSN